MSEQFRTGPHIVVCLEGFTLWCGPGLSVVVCLNIRLISGKPTTEEIEAICEITKEIEV